MAYSNYGLTPAGYIVERVAGMLEMPTHTQQC